MPYSHEAPPDLFHPRRDYTVPPGTGTFGLALFLLALGMLFAASILAYLLIRIIGQAHDVAMGTIQLPMSLWASTAIIITSSFTIHYALHYVRLERQRSFRKAITLTMVLAIAFLLVQGPSLAYVLREHWAFAAKNIYLYGLVFALILLHAAHVLGGVIPLGVITFKAHRGAYDHEHYMPVKHIAIYWHFLDAVWLIMFASFLISA